MYLKNPDNPSQRLYNTMSPFREDDLRAGRS